MRTIKNIISFLFSRLFIVAVMLVLQLALLTMLIVYFSRSVLYVYMLFNVISFFVVLAIMSNNENPSYKLTWIIAIFVFPLTGGIFYLLFSSSRMPLRLKKRVGAIFDNTMSLMPSNALADKHLAALNPTWHSQSVYIYKLSGNPVFENTSSKYFPLGECMFEHMTAELEKAEKFIFMEFFIIKQGIMWDAIFKILQQKAAAGVEVRLIYDDLGCINSIPKGYDKLIRSFGINLCAFNPFKPRVSMILNHRDHRKIIVIDGKTAFLGGINIADEYINQFERFGHWKDTGVMLKGEAVWTMSLMFLQMWRFSSGEDVDFEKYKAENNIQPSDGLVQPFGDSPLDKANITETAYLNIIYRAKKYVYITTPYLVIDNAMERALCSAAQSGVDVRIITPYIYDKWYVHLLTRSHYPQLIRAGVKIYEYEPGFMHAKMFVSDDNICMVGTCNIDFRSFYLHFECSAVFYESGLIADVKNDMLDCQKLSHQVAPGEAETMPMYLRVIRAFLKLFAPLM